MSNTECSRCGGEGQISKYSHVAGGVCFKCGKGPAAARVANGWTRERVINKLHTMIQIARACAAGERETLADWCADVCSDEACPSLPGMLAIADADVRARALAALPAEVRAYLAAR